MSQFVVDNRQLPYQDFHIDASYASYQRNVSSLIGKYCTLSGVYSWLQHPTHIAFALSPDKIRLVPKSQWSAGQVSALLEPRYSCVGSTLIAKSTWSAYFTDALHKLLESFQKLPWLEKENSSSWTWYLLSTDLCLLGDHRSTCLEEGLDVFCRACKAVHAYIPRLKIRIICTIISDQTGAIHFDNPHMLTVHSKLNQLSEFVSFHSVMNSALHFDEELRCMVSQCAPQMCTKFDFPALFGAHCSLVLQLSASTGTAGNAMHAGLKQPQLCSLVPRAQVDPVLIDGKALHVTCPSLSDAQGLLTSERSHHENKLTFRGVARWLAQHDILIVVRVPCALSDSALVSDQFWALVPPAAGTSLASTNVTSISASPELPSPGGRAADAGTRAGTVRGVSAWDYMQLLKLVDSDDILVPRDRLVNTRTTSSPSSSALSSSFLDTPIIGPASAATAQVTPIMPLHSDSQEPFGEAKDLELEEKLHQHTFETEEEDEMMMQDVADYLDASLERSLGAPDKYNPMLCASGTINNMFELQCKASCNSNARTATTPTLAPSAAPVTVQRDRGLTLHSKPAVSAAPSSAVIATTTSTVASDATAKKPSAASTAVSRVNKPLQAPPVPTRGAARGTSANVGGKKRLIASSFVDKIDLDRTSDADNNPSKNNTMRPRSRKTSAFTAISPNDDASEPELQEPEVMQGSRPSSVNRAVAIRSLVQTTNTHMTSGGNSTDDSKGARGDRGSRGAARGGKEFAAGAALTHFPQTASQTASQTAPRTAAPAASARALPASTSRPVALPFHSTAAQEVDHQHPLKHSLQQQQKEEEEAPAVPRFFKRKFGTVPAPTVAVPPVAWYDEEEGD